MTPVIETNALDRRPSSRYGLLRILFAVSLIWLAPTLACGSFAQRPTPTPTALPAPAAVGGEPVVTVASTPVVLPTLPPLDTPTLPPEPTPTFTPTVVPGTALAPGQPARVTAPAGLNLRDTPVGTGNLILQLATNLKVTILEGPVKAENLTWWKLDDGQGHVGWAADGDGETVWISPKVGDAAPVNRAPRVGERVVVTTEAGQELSVRAVPCSDAPLVARVTAGRQFTVLAGPQSADGFTWYQIRSDDGQVEGWAADGDASRRWMSPLE
jgi:hypothetical protein